MAKQNNTRKRTSEDVETNVLLKGARRCPLCFRLNGDLTEKHGQIAHLDQNPSNTIEENLAFMCMPHHSDYDSTTRQHKNFTIAEVKDMRDNLYEAIASKEHHQAKSDGGRGGNAKVEGSGIAIGGPGGKGGKYGKAGDGGSAEVKGEGLAAGGEGGSVDSNNLWYPPARSGYEIASEQFGRPIDPKMRQIGRGGMSPGYLVRYNIAESIRSEYFRINRCDPVSALENVTAVPLDYVNRRLVEMGYDWRARIAKLDYEFYVPSTN
jgi:hypothetical protein